MSARGKWILFLLVAMAAMAGWRLLHRTDGAATPTGASGPGGRGGKPGDETPIPVTVVAATTRDVPLTLSALGTVQASSTVAVVAQVSGQLKALHFTEGGEVKKGDLLAEIDPRSYQANLAQAEAKRRQDAAQLSASRSTLARYEELKKKNFVSAQDLENQRQSVRQQEAQQAGNVAAVAGAQTELSFTRILAPITGIAGIRQTDVGNLVQANGSTLVTLTQVHPINVLFSLPAQELERVRKAQAAGAVGVAALAREDSHSIADDGELRVIDNQIDSATGTFRVKAEFSNADNTLWPGQFVNVRMAIGMVKNGLVVPTQAVQRGPDGEFVYLLQEGDTVKVQPVVSAGEAGATDLLIASGLAAGDRVVTEGQFRLKPGSKVKPLAPGEVPPAPTPEEQKAAEARGARGGRPRG